jgi:O-antigen/teichoic acid export membrane protein
MDLGFAKGLIYHTSRLLASGKREQIVQYSSTSLVFYAIAGLIMATSLYFSRTFLVQRVFEVSTEYWTDSMWVIVGTSVGLFFDLIFSCFQSVLIGLQRMDLVNLNMLGKAILSAMGTYVVLRLGLGIKGLVVNSGISILAFATCNYIQTQRHLPGRQFNIWSVNKKAFFDILKYSSITQIGSISSTVVQPMNKIFIAKTASLAYLSFYEIATHLALRCRSVIAAAINPIFPGMSYIKSMKANTSALNIWQRYTRYIFMTIPLFWLGYILAGQLMDIWIGPGYPVAALSLRIAILAEIFTIIGLSCENAIMGLGRPLYRAYILGGALLTNFLVIILFLGKYGYNSILAGFVSGCAFYLVSGIFAFLRAQGTNYSESFSFLKVRFVYFTVILAAIAYWIARIWPYWEFWGIAMFAILYLSIYGAGLRLLRLLGRSDLELVLLYLKRIKVPK